MNCPIDMTELQAMNYEGVIEVDVCPKCQGMWLDQGELEAIQDLKVNDYADELEKIPAYFDKSYQLALAMKETACDCPNCGKEMEKREYGYCSLIIIDVCPDCRGVWLYKDEIKELEIFFERYRIETADIRMGFFRGLLSCFN